MIVIRKDLWVTYILAEGTIAVCGRTVFSQHYSTMLVLIIICRREYVDCTESLLSTRFSQTSSLISTCHLPPITQSLDYLINLID